MKTTKKINSGIIKLTSENISKGLVRKKIDFLLKNQKTLDDDQLISIRRKIIPDVCIGEDIFVFAYGSLLWNPTFRYVNQLPATILAIIEVFA